MNKLQFANFVQRVRSLGLERTECMTSAHHSNGSGRDWEALQRELAAGASPETIAYHGGPLGGAR